MTWNKTRRGRRTVVHYRRCVQQRLWCLCITDVVPSSVTMQYCRLASRNNKSSTTQEGRPGSLSPERRRWEEEDTGGRAGAGGAGGRRGKRPHRPTLPIILKDCYFQKVGNRTGEESFPPCQRRKTAGRHSTTCQWLHHSPIARLAEN